MERDRPNTKRFLRLQISTHTLTWSVTIYAVMKCIYVQDFNSHAHVERDLSIIDVLPTPFISTHTLTWSVTW